MPKAQGSVVFEVDRVGTVGRGKDNGRGRSCNMNFIVFFFSKIECDSCNVPRCMIQDSVIYEERMCAHNYVDAFYTGDRFR